MDNEQWKYITDLSTPGVIENKYMISSFGRVLNVTNNTFPSIFQDDEGYLRVYINTINGFKLKYIHRLVKIEFDGFDPDPNKNQVDHVDCNKSNNHPSNLEWVTREENAIRGIKNNLYYQFDVKISEEDVEFVCQKLKEGKSYKYISDLLYPKYNQDMVRIIGKIYRGERWKHISQKYMPFPELEKEHSIPSNSVLTEAIVTDICEYLQNGHGITETARYIEDKYSIDIDLENVIGFIKRRKTWKHISKNYNL